MNVYRLSTTPSVADYARGLSHLQHRISDDQRRLFQTHYNAKNRAATAKTLAALADISGGHPRVNSYYGRLGHLFCDTTRFEPDVRPDGTFR